MIGANKSHLREIAKYEKLVHDLRTEIEKLKAENTMLKTKTATK